MQDKADGGADFEFGEGPRAGVALVVSDGPLRGREVADLARSMGYGDGRHVSFAALGEDWARLDGMAMLVVDADREDAAFAAGLAEIDSAAAARGLPCVVVTQMPLLETVFAMFSESRVSYVVGAGRAELVAYLASGLRPLQRVGEGGGSPYAELRAISEEVAALARRLGEIGGAEREARPATLADPGRGYRAGPKRTVTAAMVRAEIARRRLRERYFEPELFADPAWDMLLDLYAAGLEGKQVSVSSLCIAANVPPTTGLRWLTLMTEQGLFERRQDPRDARRVFMELSEGTRAAMQGYFEAL